jgi:hypothetical protein
VIITEQTRNPTTGQYEMLETGLPHIGRNIETRIGDLNRHRDRRGTQIQFFGNPSTPNTHPEMVNRPVISDLAAQHGDHRPADYPILPPSPHPIQVVLVAVPGGQVENLATPYRLDEAQFTGREQRRRIFRILKTNQIVGCHVLGR